MTEKSDNKGEKSGDKDKTHWPWWGQFLLAVIALSIACILLIWLPMEIGSKTILGSNSTGGTAGNAFTTFAPMIVVFVGLTTMTISGMFLFMTFRIDRGARLTAREEAQSVARGEARNAAKEEIKKIAEIEAIIENTRKQKERAVRCMDSAKGELREAKDEFSKGREQIKNSVEEVDTAGGEAVARMKRIETDITDTLKRSVEDVVEDVRGRVREAEKEARDRIAEIDAKARAEVKKAGDEARNDIEDAGKKIEREMKHEMKNIEGEAVNRTTEQVDRLIAEARGKIDEADIEKLLDERIEPILARLADRRGGMFSFRGRNPRS